MMTSPGFAIESARDLEARSDTVSYALPEVRSLVGGVEGIRGDSLLLRVYEVGSRRRQPALPPDVRVRIVHDATVRLSTRHFSFIKTAGLAFGTVDSWLLWKLTGGRVHATDVSNASRTLLFDLRRLLWDEELLELFGVPAAVLPEVVPSSGVVAEAELLGARVPVAGIAGDQQAALFGQACHARGMAKNTYGTGCFMLLHTGDKVVTSTHGLISTACAQTGAAREYALEGRVCIGGCSGPR